MIEAVVKRGIADFDAGQRENPYTRDHFRRSWWEGHMQRRIEVAEKATAAAAELPSVGRWAQGGRDDGTSYLIGLRILATPNVAMVCQHNFTDIREASFTGWCPSQFHYCPEGKWDEWVALAKNILAVDAALSVSRPASNSEAK